jgi:hypothetical protein
MKIFNNKSNTFLKRNFSLISYKKFCEKYTINSEKIEKKRKRYTEEISKITKREKRFKYFYYLLGIFFPSLYIYYVAKSSGLFKKLEIDKKLKERAKVIEIKNNIDLAVNDKLIKDFDKKWGINFLIEEYENRIKFGNKELNEREENISNNVINIDINNDNTLNKNNEISKEIKTDPKKFQSTVMFYPENKKE